MPKVGEEEFAYTPEGIEAAKAKSLDEGVPITNAPDRIKQFQIGGMVQPPAPAYKKGGKV